MDLERFGSCTLDDEGCVSCGDVAVPVRVLACGGAAGDALVEDRLGRRAEVAVDFVPDVRLGEVLLVHGGVALARVAPTRTHPEPDRDPAPGPRPAAARGTPGRRVVEDGR